MITTGVGITTPPEGRREIEGEGNAEIILLRTEAQRMMANARGDVCDSETVRRASWEWEYSREVVSVLVPMGMVLGGYHTVMHAEYGARKTLETKEESLERIVLAEEHAEGRLRITMRQEEIAEVWVRALVGEEGRERDGVVATMERKVKMYHRSFLEGRQRLLA